MANTTSTMMMETMITATAKRGKPHTAYSANATAAIGLWCIIICCGTLCCHCGGLCCPWEGGGAKAAAGGYDANDGMGNHTVTKTAHNCSSVVASLCQAPTTREEEHPLLFASATFNVNNAGVGTCIKDNGNRLSSGW